MRFSEKISRVPEIRFSIACVDHLIIARNRLLILLISIRMLSFWIRALLSSSAVGAMEPWSSDLGGHILQCAACPRHVQSD